MGTDWKIYKPNSKIALKNLRNDFNRIIELHSDDEKIVKTIKLKFKKTGVIPDKIKRSYELNMPAHMAVKEINNKYGNVTNSISDVKLSLALSSANPGANM